jgi:hypothetical protein
MFEHIKRSDNHPLTRKISKIKSIFQVEYFKSFIFKIQDSISHNEAFCLEIELIKSIGRIDLNTGPLCNLTDGGDGLSSISRDVRKAKSEKLKGDKCYMFGVPKSEEIKSKISNSLKGRSLDIKTKTKIKETTNSKEYKQRRYTEKWRETASKMQKGLRLCLWKVSNVSTGETLLTKNLYEFCVERGINYGSLKNTFNRKTPISKGNGKDWILLERTDWKDL